MFLLTVRYSYVTGLSWNTVQCLILDMELKRTLIIIVVLLIK